MKRIDYIACLEDVRDVNAWSGIPNHFYEAAVKLWPDVLPVSLISGIKSRLRLKWRFNQIMRLRNPLGFQYSKEFLDYAESQLPPNLAGKVVLSFSQHYPRAETIVQRGGAIVYYVDAPLFGFREGKGLLLRLPESVWDNVCKIEQSNYQRAKCVITMASWARLEILNKFPHLQGKVFTIKPGANIKCDEVIKKSKKNTKNGGNGFVFGLVGMDWRRKGLPLIVDVVAELRHRGVNARVMIIGGCPPEYQKLDYVDFRGRIDKNKNLSEFIENLTRCDLGCLFSEREAFGISILEFLRCGVPVVGYSHEGLADAIPDDSGIKFDKSSSRDVIVRRLLEYINNAEEQSVLCRNAEMYSAQLKWERVVSDVNNLINSL